MIFFIPFLLIIIIVIIIIIIIIIIFFFYEFSYTITFTRLPKIAKVYRTIKQHFHVGNQMTEHTHLLQTHILGCPVGQANKTFCRCDVIITRNS